MWYNWVMKTQITIPEGFEIHSTLYLHKNKKGTVKHELICIEHSGDKYWISYRGPKKKHQIYLTFTLDSLENLPQELENKIVEYKLEHL